MYGLEETYEHMCLLCSLWIPQHTLFLALHFVSFPELSLNLHPA